MNANSSRRPTPDAHPTHCHHCGPKHRRWFLRYQNISACTRCSRAWVDKAHFTVTTATRHTSSISYTGIGTITRTRTDYGSAIDYLEKHGIHDDTLYAADPDDTADPDAAAYD